MIMSDVFRLHSRSSRFSRTLLGAASLGVLMAVVPLAPCARADAPEAIKPSTQLQTLPNFVNLVKQVKPAVVSITSHIKESGAEQEGPGGGMQGGGSPFPFPFPFQMMPQQQNRTVEARGSGFLISHDGYIVTNNHVIKGATKVTVTLDDGTTLPAKIVGRDPKTDIALLKVTPSGNLPFIQLGESNTVEPGEWVIAVGNPYGLGGSVTAGIVSARDRDIHMGQYDDFIQIDAPINHGNSGGPLLSQDGKVIGVNAAMLEPSGGSIGIGFAIPSDTVRNVVDQLRKNGHVTRGYLGVMSQNITPNMAQAMNLPSAGPGAPPMGALVSTVENGTPADKAGLKSGDVITTLNGQRVKDPHDLAVRVVSIVPGSKASLGILRDNKPQTLDVTIGNAAGGKGSAAGATNGGSGQSSGKIGLSLTALTADVRQQLGVDDSVRGAVVSDVVQGSPAEQAGIRPGDIIQAVGNHPVENQRAAVTAIGAALSKNHPALLRILRDNRVAFVAVAPAGADQGDQGQENGNDDDNNDDGNN